MMFIFLPTGILDEWYYLQIVPTEFYDPHWCYLAISAFVIIIAFILFKRLSWQADERLKTGPIFYGIIFYLWRQILKYRYVEQLKMETKDCFTNQI